MMKGKNNDKFLTRREFIRRTGTYGAVGAGMVLGLDSLAHAAKFPSKDIKLIVPWSAGGGTDFVGRALMKNAKKYFGVNVAVINMPGAGGITGATAIAQSRPDGYTVGIQGQYLTSKWLQGVTEYNISSFDNLMIVNRGPACIAVRSDSKYKTIKDLLEDAKAHPGVVTMSIAGVGGAWHLAAVGLFVKMGIKVKFVAYQGAAPARASMLGGHVSSVSCGISELYSFYKSKEVRILASCSAERHPRFPDVPTLIEQGYQHQAYVIRFLSAPKGVPKDRFQILQEGFKKCYNDPDFIKLMDKRGFGRFLLMGKEFDDFIEADMKEQVMALKEIGMLKRKIQK
ncbi:MAG: tripartite tricarboxylate transporter substrate binding protein [Deltaproteobacteria bacterium]|nr:tripartite tricarboxylate transporter substrate binding protein [Deltaproteobacteria bacterium]MBW2309293.1 tripartite tricarboxylate transporter substrate binding protein [Deltaproteobacteria bacterium]